MVGDIKVSDVLGLGKMVEVIGRGIGTVYKPYHLKRLSEVRVKQIEDSSAAASLQGEVKSIEFTDESFKLSYQRSLLKKDVSQDLVNAAQVRFIEREVRRQINIESTIQKAALSFDDEEKVTDEEISQEWIDRYFDSIQDISNEDLQELWAKVLAGEIKKSSSFSLRTLDILKNMTTDEAEIFAKVAKISIDMGTACILINDLNLLSQYYELSYSDILLLNDIGLLNSKDTLVYQFDPIKKASSTGFSIGNLVAIISYGSNTPNLSIKSFALTKSGTDLCRLVEKEKDSFYEPIIQKLAIILKSNDSVKLYISTGSNKNNAMQYDPENMREL
jgi:hypothetical protein